MWAWLSLHMWMSDIIVCICLCFLSLCECILSFGCYICICFCPCFLCLCTFFVLFCVCLVSSLLFWGHHRESHISHTWLFLSFTADAPPPDLWPVGTGTRKHWRVLWGWRIIQYLVLQARLLLRDEPDSSLLNFWEQSQPTWPWPLAKTKTFRSVCETTNPQNG